MDINNFKFILKRKIHMKIMLLINFIICNFYCVNLALAKCNAVAGLLTINGRDIVVDNETPVFTLLDTFSLGSFQTYRCDDNNTANMRTGGKAYGDFATYIDGIRVYKTNIEGIGYSFGVQSMCGDMSFPSSGWRDNLDNIATCWNEDIWNQITHNFDVRIYKIGPTGSGIVEKKKIGATILAFNNQNMMAHENSVLLSNFRVVTLNNNDNKPNNNGSIDNNSGQSNNNGSLDNSGGQSGNSGQEGNNNINNSTNINESINANESSNANESANANESTNMNSSINTNNSTNTNSSANTNSNTNSNSSTNSNKSNKSSNINKSGNNNNIRFHHHYSY
ncbi:hypothetical protein [Arsenophonus endosymbiont of Crataerina pallida]|uniref:hypothetical protein n=2 Tax=unclassified Arsenophonus TaxID=2627083 RepID=UPI0030CE280A